MKKLTFLFALLCASVLGFAEEVKDTIAMIGFANGTLTSYVTTATEGTSAKGVKFTSNQYNPTTGQVKGNQITIANQWFLYNTDAMPGNITTIEVTQTGDTTGGSNKFQNHLWVALGKVAKGDVTTLAESDSVIKVSPVNKQKFLIEVPENTEYKYLKICSNEKFGSGTLKGVQAVITYQTADEQGGEDTGCKWDDLEFLGDGLGDGAYSNQFKVCAGENQNVVNIQKPGFSEVGGIYTNFTDYGAITAISLAEGQYDLDGAGVILHLDALTAIYTEITVTLAVDSKQITFTVYNAKGTEPTVAVTSVALNKTELTLEPEATETLVATVAPNDATDKSLVWTSSDEAIATVDANGKVTAVAAGTATITVKTVDGDFTATCALTVAVAPKATIADVFAATTGTNEGDEFNMNDLTVYYVNGNNVFAQDATGRILIFNKSNAIAGLENGKVIKGLKAKAKLYNKQPEISTIVNAAEVVVEDGTLVETIEMTAVPVAADNYKHILLKGVVFTEDVTFVTSGIGNNVTAKVGEDNIVVRNAFKVAQEVKANKKYDIEGIVFDYGGTVQLQPIAFTEVVVPATGITLDETALNLNVDEERTLVATLEPEGSAAEITWVSADPTKVTVDQNGKVKAIAETEPNAPVLVTAKISDDIKAECYVTVEFVQVAVTGVKLSDTALELKVGEEDVVNVTVEPANANDRTFSAVSADVEKVTVEVVDNTIVVKAVAQTEPNAPVKITVTTTDGSFTAECYVSVVETRDWLTVDELFAEDEVKAVVTAGNGTTASTFTVRGYVTKIKDEWSDEFGNISFFISDEVNGETQFEAYQVKPIDADADKDVKVGDFVEVVGKVTIYKGTVETVGKSASTYTILEVSEDAKDLGDATIEEFLAAADAKNTYHLTGVVSGLPENKYKEDDEDKLVNEWFYGNFTLTDETGEIYIFGLLTAEGEAKKFIELNVENGDTLTLKGVYTTHNGEPQIANAIFIEVVKAQNPVEGLNTLRQEVKAVKFFDAATGRIVILRGEQMFDLSGKEIK